MLDQFRMCVLLGRRLFRWIVCSEHKKADVWRGKDDSGSNLDYDDNTNEDRLEPWEIPSKRSLEKAIPTI